MKGGEKIMLDKFHVGHRVIVIGNFHYYECGTITAIDKHSYKYPLTVELDCGEFVEGNEFEFIPVNSIKKPEVANKSNMGAGTLQKLTILAKTLVDADLKTLLKAGWLSSSLELTAEGEDAIFAHYLTANKAALAKLAKAEMKDRKKGKDCEDDEEETQA